MGRHLFVAESECPDGLRKCIHSARDPRSGKRLFRKLITFSNRFEAKPYLRIWYRNSFGHEQASGSRRSSEETPLSMRKNHGAERRNQRWLAPKQKRYPIQIITMRQRC